MTPILKFTSEELGRQVATLGAVQIGEVMRMVGKSRPQACYAVWLPDVPKRFVPADSMFVARSAVVRVIEDWLNRIGVFGPGDHVEVQIEGEDDALPVARRQAGGRG